MDNLFILNTKLTGLSLSPSNKDQGRNKRANETNSFKNITYIENSLPKVMHTESNFNDVIKNSERNIINYKSSNFSLDSKSKEDVFNHIYQVIFSKVEKISLKNNYFNCESLIKAFLEIFESFASSYDIRFNNIVELIKTLKSCKSNENLNEINKKLQLDLDTVNKNMRKKDNLCHSYLDKINEYEANMNILKKKHKQLKANYKEEAQEMNNYLNDFNREFLFLRDKENKLMKLIYLVHKEGFDVDGILKKHKDINIGYNNQELSLKDTSYTDDNANELSTVTVNFPDKVTMEPITTYFVPKLNFTSLPKDESDEEEEQQQKQFIEKNTVNKKIANTLNNQANTYKTPEQYNKNIVNVNNGETDYINLIPKDSKCIKSNFNNNTSPNVQSNNTFPLKSKKSSVNSINLNDSKLSKIKDYNSEFMEKYDEYSESWRNGIDQTKLLKESMNDKNKNS